ncbi:MAG TPA: imidazole glycerol phosphate synthase subunit HisH [Planosporangium sp.]|nr:imidazole glycerol phosphate synthase subunit HisH [Planosporangium sp.]
MAARVVVLDYGSGNLRSAQRALERVGASVVVTDDLGAARDADGLVVPGVGAYAACMAGIEAIDAGPAIADRVRDGRPVLGICVGMQVLFCAGEEHGVVTKGLGLLPGAVTRLSAPVVPHMGWNTVDWPSGSSLGRGVDAGTRFYFVHSYAAPPLVEGAAVATATHGGAFAAAVEHGALSATQFHPEKSGDAGATLLANWVGALP